MSISQSQHHNNYSKLDTIEIFKIQIHSLKIYSKISFIKLKI